MVSAVASAPNRVAPSPFKTASLPETRTRMGPVIWQPDSGKAKAGRLSMCHPAWRRQERVPMSFRYFLAIGTLLVGTAWSLAQPPVQTSTPAAKPTARLGLPSVGSELVPAALSTPLAPDQEIGNQNAKPVAA